MGNATLGFPPNWRETTLAHPSSEANNWDGIETIPAEDEPVHIYD